MTGPMPTNDFHPAARPLEELVQQWRELADLEASPGVLQDDNIARHYRDRADELDAALRAARPVPQLDYRGAFMLLYSDIEDFVKIGWCDSARDLATHRLLQFASLMLDRPVSETKNPLTHELLDLIVLMPDSQVDEILTFVRELRAARRNRSAADPPVPGAGGRPRHENEKS